MGWARRAMLGAGVGLGLWASTTPAPLGTTPSPPRGIPVPEQLHPANNARVATLADYLWPRHPTWQDTSPSRDHPQCWEASAELPDRSTSPAQSPNLGVVVVDLHAIYLRDIVIQPLEDGHIPTGAQAAQTIDETYEVAFEFVSQHQPLGERSAQRSPLTHPSLLIVDARVPRQTIDHVVHAMTGAGMVTVDMVVSSTQPAANNRVDFHTPLHVVTVCPQVLDTGLPTTSVCQNIDRYVEHQCPK